MSLIHEALRKARREAAREEDPGVIYPGGLTGRPRRGMAVGVLVGVVATIVFVVLVVATLWWAFRPGGSESSDGSTVERSSMALRPTAAALEDPTEPAHREPSQPAATAGVFDRSPGDAGASGSTAEIHVSHSGPGPTPRAVVFSTPTPVPDAASNTRDFVADADLGYARLTLDYIVARPSDPFAQINGFDVRVGSVIEGFTVEAITAEEVRLRDNRGPLVLRAE